MERHGIRQWRGRGLAAIAALLLLLSACGQLEEMAAEGSVRVYHLNREENSLGYESVLLESEEPQEQIKELIGYLSAQPADPELHMPLRLGSELVDWWLEEENQLVLVMDEHYRELSPTTEVLLRAALVRSFTQLAGIDSVSMQIGEEALSDRSGNPIGMMYADSFIDNEGAEINAYEQTTLHLYYANEDGTGLIETQRTLIYNTNISMERLVVEQLIAGPQTAEAYPVISEDTKILSVNLTEGTCYVNLSAEFQKAPGDVTPEVTVYALVNSLAELPNVYRVQLMVAGESELLYREMLSLEHPLTRNLDLADPARE